MMKINVISISILILCALAIADQPLSSSDARFYREELLKARHGMETKGYTSVCRLEERLNQPSHVSKLRNLRRFLPYSGFDHRSGMVTEEAMWSSMSFRSTGYADIPDMLVNEDGFASSFNQKNPSSCMFPDKSFLAVWEDERNGDWDVFAQKNTFDGNGSDPNYEVGYENFPKDQYLPQVSLASDTSFALVWVDEETFVIYGRIYSQNLSPLTGAFQISDSPLAYSTWAPTVSSRLGQECVIAWEDTRSGSNIYARRFDLSGNPLGLSFKVNDDEGSYLHASPNVSVDTSGNFVVVWEDFRNLQGDIYAQRFESGGIKLGDNVLVSMDSLDEDQYTPNVGFDPNDRFVVAWVDLRRENASVFARSTSFNDPTSDTLLFQVGVQISSTVYEKPFVVSDTLDRFAISWTEYTLFDRTNYVRRFDEMGNALGDAIIISDLYSTGERHSLTLSGSFDGSLVAVWMDKQAGNYDIYARTIPAYGTPQGSIRTLNDDLMGANQSRPKIAVRPDGNFIVVWEDKRRGASDIFMKRFNQDALSWGSDYMVNDSTARVYRGNPDVAFDSAGDFAVVWEDARGSILDIYTQLFDSSGNLNGGNSKVNCAGTVTNSTPNCAMSPEGVLVVTWSAASGSTTDIYSRLFSSAGLPLDTCFKVNDDTGSANHFSPAIAMDGLGRFVVAWQDGREGYDRVYLQRFASDGSRIGLNFPVHTDRLNPSQYNPDLDLNQEGEFVVVWTELSAYSTMIYAQRYDSSGSPLDTNIAVLEEGFALPECPRVKLADDGYMIVAWTEQGAYGSDVYYRVFMNGVAQGPKDLVNTEGTDALQDSPDIGIWDSRLFSVWRDNRIPGLGYSIFFNRTNYEGSGVWDEQESESLPVGFTLHQNYPNPFNPTTTIRYSIDPVISGNHSIHVNLLLYNVLGQRVCTLVDEYMQPGEYRVTWEGRGDQGVELPSGVYFYRLKVQNQAVVRKLLLLK